jgi:hypothetical protein
MPPGNALEKRSSAVTQLWHRITLGGILLVTAFLNVYDLQKVGYGNVYYSAAVKSMLTSWHNFFFVSFDAAGFVSVDKPPLGLWIQAASAKLFGFSGLSVILPEAVAGVLSVVLLYHLVHRVFGPVTGLIAALVLAITPVSIATNRDNIIDSLLGGFLGTDPILTTKQLASMVATGTVRFFLVRMVVVMHVSLSMRYLRKSVQHCLRKSCGSWSKEILASLAAWVAQIETARSQHGSPRIAAKYRRRPGNRHHQAVVHHLRKAEDSSCMTAHPVTKPACSA